MFLFGLSQLGLVLYCIQVLLSVVCVYSRWSSWPCLPITAPRCGQRTSVSDSFQLRLRASFVHGRTHKRAYLQGVCQIQSWPLRRQQQNEHVFIISSFVNSFLFWLNKCYNDETHTFTIYLYILSHCRIRFLSTSSVMKKDLILSILKNMSI